MDPVGLITGGLGGISNNPQSGAGSDGRIDARFGTVNFKSDRSSVMTFVIVGAAVIGVYLIWGRK
jgi:hypothetical protein